VTRKVQLTALRIDLGADFSLAAVAGARRFSDGILHRTEHDLAVDRFLSGDRVGNLQEFEFIGAYGRHSSVSLGLTHELVVIQRVGVFAVAPIAVFAPA
jgi:hypothetical protein